MEDISIHDNFLLAYSVLCREREIHLHTAFLDGETHEYTDVIFSGVAAYHFEGDNLDTIILDIEEVDVEGVLPEYRDLFGRLRNYGWPMSYGSVDELLREMRGRGVKAFIISSSYGLSGWVWAEGMSKRSRGEARGGI